MDSSPRRPGRCRKDSHSGGKGWSPSKPELPSSPSSCPRPAKVQALSPRGQPWTEEQLLDRCKAAVPRVGMTGPCENNKCGATETTRRWHKKEDKVVCARCARHHHRHNCFPDAPGEAAGGGGRPRYTCKVAASAHCPVAFCLLECPTCPPHPSLLRAAAVPRVGMTGPCENNKCGATETTSRWRKAADKVVCSSCYFYHYKNNCFPES